jgi:hypothetical protein
LLGVHVNQANLSAVTNAPSTHPLLLDDPKELFLQNLSGAYKTPVRLAAMKFF